MRIFTYESSAGSSAISCTFEPFPPGAAATNIALLKEVRVWYSTTGYASTNALTVRLRREGSTKYDLTLVSQNWFDVQSMYWQPDGGPVVVGPDQKIVVSLSSISTLQSMTVQAVVD